MGYGLPRRLDGRLLAFLRFIRFVFAVVLALDLLRHVLGALRLELPLGRAHLLLLVEEVGVGLAVGAADAVPEGGVLAVVVVEVEVVHSVAGSAINDRAIGHVLAVVDHDGPEVDEDEQRHGRVLVQREQDRVQVVGERLREPVDGVEGVRGEGRRHDPLVVRLVQVLVDQGVVQAAVDQVDQGVGEDEEARELQELVPHAGAVGRRIVQLRVSADLEEPEDGGEQSHARKGLDGLPDLHRNLVLEVLGMGFVVLVEHEPVGEGGEDEV